jgi:arylsulfatase A-like enzyme
LRVLHAAGGFRLGEEVPTLATLFKEAGYRTAAVHSAFPVSSYFGLTRDFDYVDSFDGAMQSSDTAITTWTVGQLQRRSNDSVDSALKWLREEDDRPFFLWLHLWDPHDSSLLPPDDYMEGFEAEESERYRAERIYAREVAFVDQNIGLLIEGMRAAALWDNTLTALISDHGEGLTDGVARHGWYSHRMLYREQIHVPFVLRLPTAMGNRGRVCPELVRSADLAPTVLDYCALEIPPNLDGRSLRALIEGAPDEARTAYSDQINAFDTNAGLVLKRPDAAFLFSVQKGPWKVVWRPHMTERSELFNVALDPGEETNLWNTEPEMRTTLLDNLAERAPWVLQAFDPLESEGAAAQGALSALGYSGADEVEGLTWTCPAHLDRAEARAGSCPSCDRKLLPVTEWK